MVLTTVNEPRQVLHLSFIGRVRAAHLQNRDAEMNSLLKTLRPGFRLLTDLGRLESITEDCAPLIGRMMEVFDRQGVGLIVRVIPDSSKDIGMNILSLFHYPHHPTTLTCQTMEEAGERLGL